MSAVELGATLYVPAINSGLRGMAYGAVPDLRSMVVCLEDAIREDQVPLAISRLQALLADIAVLPPQLSIYVRPRNLRMLTALLQLEGIERVKGFVLPKMTTQSLPVWLTALMHSDHHIMPTIEGEDAFDRSALARLCDQLMPYAERVSAIRIGGNDILALLGIRRSRVRTAYDGPLGSVIRDIAGTFIPNGFSVAAPVFEHFSSPDILRREVEQDIEHGLLTKTAIHPDQIAIIHAVYRPDSHEMAEARAILSQEAPAVFGSNGSMCELATHAPWAGMIIKRAQTHGIAGVPDAMLQGGMMVA
jgi:citrate lyase beta subunit